MMKEGRIGQDLVLLLTRVFSLGRDADIDRGKTSQKLLESKEKLVF